MRRAFPTRLSSDLDALSHARAGGEAEERIAGGADAVSVIGERALRHPFDARRDVQRVGAEAHFGAVDVARDDRQAVVAELDVAAETEVAVGVDLSQPEPGGDRKSVA